MLVTLHARHTAMYRVLRQQGLSRTADRIEFHKLDRAWERRCGLRRADLLEAIAELSLADVITQTSGSEGTVIEVTEHGSRHLQSGARLLRSFSWSQPLASAAEALHTAVTLYRAGLRTRRFLRSSRTLVIDRRGRV